jgi:glutathione synthase/RimK-type ligase-like ATP-grasp enzyme
MRLKVAVQMDPIERINIRGDSTFALLLEAQRREHAIAYYPPDRLAPTRSFTPQSVPAWPGWPARS